MKYQSFRRKIRSFPLFSTSMLNTLAGNVETLKVQLSVWKKKGLIHSVRRGLYVLNPEDRQCEPSLFYLANQIFVPSYVSLESALAYHGLIPEFVSATTSVTARKTCRFENDFGSFIYQHVRPEGYGGFEAVREGGKLAVLVAMPEKAVVDFLYLNLSQFRSSDRLIFKKSYRFQNCENLRSKELMNYAKRFQSKKLLAMTDLFIKELVSKRQV